MNIKHIIRGFYNWIIGKERKIMRKRLKICKKCLQNDDGICSVCGCFLKAKASEPDENCPLNKW